MKFHELLDDSYLSKLFESDISAGTDKVIKTVTEHGFRTLINLPETYKDYLMSLRKKMRNNITRTFSRLENEQQYTIDSISEMQEVDESVAILTELNLSRRGSMNKYSVFEQENFVRFHRRIIKRLLPLNKGSFRILRLTNKPVAVLYSFIDGDTIHPYQSGFEKDNGQRYSLLTTMLTQEISNSINNPRLKRFNFMYSDEESTYKKRYSGTTEAMYRVSFDKPGIKYRVYRLIHGPLKELTKKLLRK